MYASADIEADMAYYIYRKFETCVICYCHDVWNCRNNIEEFIFIIKKNYTFRLCEIQVHYLH